MMYKVEIKRTDKFVVDQFNDLRLAYDFYHMSHRFEDVVYSKLYMNDILLEKFKRK